MVINKHFSTLSSILAATLFLSTNVSAAQPGYYLGLQPGWGNITDTGISIGDMNHLIGTALGYDNFTTTHFNGVKNANGFAWRVTLGFQVGYQWAGEIGYMEFPNFGIDANASGLDQTTTNTFAVNTNGTFKTDAVDLVAKYMYLLPCNYNIYGKIGLALLTGYSNESGDVNELGLSVSGERENKVMRLDPTFAVGLTYDFRPDISGDVSYSRIQAFGDSDELGSFDFVSAGLIFHFG